MAQGQWGNTWRIKVDPDDDCERVRFDLVGSPLADYARANGYTDLLPHLCATDHVIPKLIHAKLIRTHTCTLGSDSCDYWYVGDESETARNCFGTDAGFGYEFPESHGNEARFNIVHCPYYETCKTSSMSVKMYGYDFSQQMAKTSNALLRIQSIRSCALLSSGKSAPLTMR